MRHIAAAAVLALAVAAPAKANDVGEIKVAKGTVHVERDGKRLPASAGMPIRQSDTLVTGADGSAGVTFSDNSMLSAGPNSVLVVDHYTFDSTTHAGKFDASLKKGSLVVNSSQGGGSKDTWVLADDPTVDSDRATVEPISVPASPPRS